MPLLRAVGRTAMIAGTATAVSNGVSRRQAGRWAEKDQASYEQQQYEQQQQQMAYAQQQAVAAPAPAAAPADDSMAKLQQLAQLHQSGVLTDEEFASAKAKILNI